MKNEERIAALADEITTKLNELFELARADGILTSSISVDARYNDRSQWWSHSGFGTCAYSYNALTALITADREARESADAVSNLRRKAQELWDEATKLEKETAPVSGTNL